MATFREIVYLTLDELKLISGDSTYTEEHILFLAEKYRALLLENKYKDVRKSQIPHSNYQTICLDLVESQDIPCEALLLKSTKPVPSIMRIGLRRVFPVDYFSSAHLTWISPERMQYVGYNKWLGNIIYATKGVDDYLYLKSNNPQFLYLKQVRIDAIFFDIQKAASLACEVCDKECDIMDMDFPIEDSLIPMLIQSMVQELGTQRYMPKDNVNNAKDDMAGMISTTQNEKG